MAKHHSRTQPIEPSMNTEDYTAGVAAPNGTRVKIDRGQVPNHEGTKTVANAGGRTAVVDGALYESKDGPNKGKLMQPVKTEGGNKLLSVPVENLQMERPSKSRGNFATGLTSDEQHRKIFGGNRKEKKWVEVRPGVRRLVTTTER